MRVLAQSRCATPNLGSKSWWTGHVLSSSAVIKSRSLAAFPSGPRRRRCTAGVEQGVVRCVFIARLGLGDEVAADAAGFVGDDDVGVFGAERGGEVQRQSTPGGGIAGRRVDLPDQVQQAGFVHGSPSLYGAKPCRYVI